MTIYSKSRAKWIKQLEEYASPEYARKEQERLRQAISNRLWVEEQQRQQQQRQAQLQQYRQQAQQQSLQALKFAPTNLPPAYLNNFIAELEMKDRGKKVEKYSLIILIGALTLLFSWVIWIVSAKQRSVIVTFLKTQKNSFFRFQSKYLFSMNTTHKVAIFITAIVAVTSIIITLLFLYMSPYNQCVKFYEKAKHGNPHAGCRHIRK